MSEKWTVHRCIMCTVYRSRSPISSLTLTLFPALSLLLPCAGNWIAISSGKRRHNWEIKTTLQRLCLWVTVADKDIQRITAVPNTSGLRHHNSRRGERERTPQRSHTGIELSTQKSANQATSCTGCSTVTSDSVQVNKVNCNKLKATEHNK